jgi:hypothetical protein
MRTLRAGRFLRPLLAALGGAAVMVGLGQLVALGAGSCNLLCQPPVAAIYGAVIGLAAASRA